MRPQQGWSSRSGCAEAGRGGRDPRCPRERYRGIRPLYRQNFAEKILANIFASQKTAARQFRRLVALDSDDLLRADPEARWASWQRTRQVGMLSPNDARTEEGWPASTDPTANEPSPALADDQGKVARLDLRRIPNWGDCKKNSAKLLSASHDEPMVATTGCTHDRHRRKATRSSCRLFSKPVGSPRL
jgi:hypothetical protein